MTTSRRINRINFLFEMIRSLLQTFWFESMPKDDTDEKVIDVRSQCRQANDEVVICLINFIEMCKHCEIVNREKNIKRIEFERDFFSAKNVHFIFGLYLMREQMAELVSIQNGITSNKCQFTIRILFIRHLVSNLIKPKRRRGQSEKEKINLIQFEITKNNIITALRHLRFASVVADAKQWQEKNRRNLFKLITISIVTEHDDDVSHTTPSSLKYFLL